MNNESFWWKNMGSLQTGIDPNIWRDQRETCASQKNCIFWGCWKGRPLFSIYHFTRLSFPQTHLISWSARSAAAVGSPADAYSGLTVTTLVLCGTTLLAGCYLLQLIFEAMAEKYVTILQRCNFWHLDRVLETDGLLDENKYWSGRNKVSGFAHNFPFLTVWYLVSLDHDEKKEEQITWPGHSFTIFFFVASATEMSGCGLASCSHMKQEVHSCLNRLPWLN